MRHLFFVSTADINVGYEDIVNTIVTGFNGTAVTNLAQLARMVETCTSEYLQFDLDLNTLVVLDTAEARRATAEILVTHCIPSAKSVDLA